MASTPDSQKTERIGWLCVTLMVLGLLIFLTKINACALACNSCNSNGPPTCKDEFYELRNDGVTATHTCYPGARAEVVTSPPAPKPGIICHCTNSDQAGSATPAPPKGN